MVSKTLHVLLRFLLHFLTFFFKIQNNASFYVFPLLHTFSRTMVVLIIDKL